MCGIVGAFQPSGRGLVSDDRLAEMRDRMRHRGPDGGGLWRSPAEDCMLGHRRLSIIDLSTTANQPMLSADGKVALVFNGEIYNHADIRAELERLGKYAFKTDHSDTEALLYAFVEWGPACVQRFYGMFAFAIYDARDPERPALHLVRDRIGIKPLYFARTDAGEWIFASEIKALLAHPAISAAMNDVAFWHYLTFIVSPAPMTLFDGVFKVPAGYWVTIDHTGRGAAHRYWDNIPRPTEYFSTKDLSFDEAVSELVRLLRVAIRRRMVSDVPFGVLLSGGVDLSSQRRVDVGVDESTSDDIHGRLQELRRVQRIRSCAPAREAVSDGPPRDGNQFRGSAGLPAASCRTAGRTDCRQCLHPALLSRAARPTERHDGGPSRRGG